MNQKDILEKQQKSNCWLNYYAKKTTSQGGEVLLQIMKEINESCLFWLDSYYSGGSNTKGKLETPINQELNCIMKHKNAAEHIILIDDARCFVGNNDYPTLQSLEKFINSICGNWSFKVKNDIIRTHG